MQAGIDAASFPAHNPRNMAKGNGKKISNGSCLTWKLARMNPAIRRMDAYLNSRNADIKAAFVPVRKGLANPPSNMSDCGGENLWQDLRWKFGMPPVNNAK